MESSRLSDTIPERFAAVVHADPGRPLLTWYDDATGERIELSGATLANWVAKTANLLADHAGLGPGDRAGVDAPPHWQTAAVLLGCWTAGLAVVPTADADAVFAAADRAAGHVGPGREVYGLALAPLAAPMRAVPPGVTDFVVEVRGHGDHFAPVTRVGPDDPATESLTHRELCEAARDRAAELGVEPAGRLLIDAAAHPDPLDWLLLPLMTGASVVLCGNLDPRRVAQRVEVERVTRTLQ